MFTDEFIDRLPDDPVRGAYALCLEFESVHSRIPNELEVDHYHEYVDAIMVLEAYAEARGLQVVVPNLSKSTTRHENIKAIYSAFRRLRDELQAQVEAAEVLAPIDAARARFRARFGATFSYEFSDSDVKRVQSLINELRNQILATDKLEPKHKQRVLDKLEALQKEVHRQVSSLDKFWGLIGEAGVVLGKLGNDAKPFVDRVREIAMITWAVQARAEELASSTTLPFLQTQERRIEEN